jgi:hypothetical protein
MREHVCSECRIRRQRGFAGPPALAVYRCRDCLVPDLVCGACSLRRHSQHPLHRIQVGHHVNYCCWGIVLTVAICQYWTGSHFVPITLKSMGLMIYLNHSTSCERSRPCSKAFRIIDTTGIHEVAVNFCACQHQIPDYQQVLRRGWYPSTQTRIETCATFRALELLHMLSNVSKGSVYDYYRTLEKLTNNTEITPPKPRIRALRRMLTQWRHLKMEKRGGRGHTALGIKGTKPGELAVLCPSCPHPGINLPPGWEDAPPHLRLRGFSS